MAEDTLRGNAGFVYLPKSPKAIGSGFEEKARNTTCLMCLLKVRSRRSGVLRRSGGAGSKRGVTVFAAVDCACVLSAWILLILILLLLFCGTPAFKRSSPSSNYNRTTPDNRTFPYFGVSIVPSIIVYRKYPQGCT